MLTLFFVLFRTAKVQQYFIIQLLIRIYHLAKVPPQLLKNRPFIPYFMTKIPPLTITKLLHFVPPTVPPTVPATSKFYFLLPCSTNHYNVKIRRQIEAPYSQPPTTNKKSHKTALLLALRLFLLLLLNDY